MFKLLKFMGPEGGASSAPSIEQPSEQRNVSDDDIRRKVAYFKEWKMRNSDTYRDMLEALDTYIEGGGIYDHKNAQYPGFTRADLVALRNAIEQESDGT